ncbi:FAD-binding protein [Desulfosporosinus fructosivorans]
MDNLQESVLVIGGGLAGITATAVAIKRGAKVTLVTNGPGTLAMSGGSISIQGMDLKHPCLEKAMGFFTAMMTAAGCEYKGELRQRQLVPNAMGSFQEVSMAPASIWSGRPVNGSKVMVLGIRGLSGFNANLTAELLSLSAGKLNLQVEYTGKMIDVPWLQTPGFNALDIANHLEDQQNRDKLAEMIKPLLEDYNLLLMPAILGLQTGSTEFARFEEKVGCSVGELYTVPPSVVGVRIFQCLLKYLQKAGAEINFGYPIQSLQLQAGRCTAAILDTPGRKRVIKADNFILATGRINKFDLVLNYEGKDTEWDQEEEAAVNEQMQLLNRDKLPVAVNVYGAGSILEGFNYRNGNAQAILTGYQAGIIAAGGEKIEC